ncbi:uncharacterized protein [Eurosta solidaginis]|uniref:uncharacterized protein n=1 Tax=Eurosta solidaginis TaxID=178769 RepID=UPI003530603B
MALKTEKRVIECSDLMKCGEITAKITVEQKEYFLNCEFCDYSFLQMENFMQHICDDHFTEFSHTNNELQEKEIPAHIMDEIEEYESNMAVEKTEDDTFEGDADDIRDMERVGSDFESAKIERSLDVKVESVNPDEGTNQKYYCETEDAIEILFKTDSEGEPEINVDEKQNFETKYDENQMFTIELIELYRSLRALWDPKCPEYTDRMIRNEQYEALLEKYKEQRPEANKDDVRQKIYALRTTFRKESKKMGPLEKPTLYYYDAMSFLIENGKRDVPDNSYDYAQDSFMQIERRTPPPESFLNDDQFIILAKIYQSYPSLWDEDDISYRFSNRRRETLKCVLFDFNEASGLDLTQNELEKEIMRLRRACSKEKKQKIKCRQNNLDYEPTSPFHEHIIFLETNVSPYECTVCGEVISGSCQYRIHFSSHDGSLPYTCKICGHGFKLTSNLTVHLRRHVQDYTYVCNVCNKACATTSELKIHLRYHTGEKNYVCEVCGAKFYTASKFNTHMRRHENRPRHRCEVCGKGFLTRGLYVEHVSTHGNIRDKICDICNKGFKNKLQLKQHKRIHDPIKKYVCKICGKRFAQNAGRAGHMKSHGTRLYEKKKTTDPELEFI